MKFGCLILLLAVPFESAFAAQVQVQPPVLERGALPATGSKLLPGQPLKVGEKIIDSSKLIGYSSPQLIDYDADGDLDLVLGSFIGRFRLFTNVGTAQKPKFTAFRYLQAADADIEVSNW